MVIYDRGRADFESYQMSPGQMRPTETSRRERKKDETRERIASAALRLFVEKGFHATTVDEISEQADVAKGTFFNYFPRKEAVLDALAERRIAEMQEVIRALMAERGPARDKLIRFVGAVATMHTEHREVSRMVLGRLLGPPDEMMQRIEVRGREMLGSLVAEGQRAGELRRDVEPDRAAHLVRSVALGTVLQWLTCRPQEFDVVAEARERVALVLDGLAMRPSRGKDA